LFWNGVQLRRRVLYDVLRDLAATDASGGVARQQKITHAHESPFYYYAQFPNPFAITYRGKNIVGYFLDSPRMFIHSQEKKRKDDYFGLISITIFWDVTHYSLEDRYHRFAKTQCLHFPL
jgi:hypothetical protein